MTAHPHPTNVKQRAQYGSQFKALRKPLALTLGEPAGIGPELILQTWQDRQSLRVPPFIVMADAAFLQRLAHTMKLPVNVKASTPENAIADFSSALPVMALSGKITGSANAPQAGDSALVCEAISRAVELTLEGRTTAIVTAPINKKALYDSGFNFPGHTEFLASLAQEITGEPYHPVMMLAGPELRVVPVTIHIALGEVVHRLTTDLIVQTGVIVNRELVNHFGIKEPRIAVCGLNPHAGENGSMGMEDISVIAPAIKQLQALGIGAFGPLSADTLFHARARAKYDAVLCMYHDQALIPAKTLAFDDSVNVTLGLPFIRTSPDHGTAYDIAGKGIANPSSLVAALKLAASMALKTAETG